MKLTIELPEDSPQGLPAGVSVRLHWLLNRQNDGFPLTRDE